MLTVQEALDLVQKHSHRLPSAQCSLRQALGRVLAESVASDLDSPPFDKSLRDGFAVKSADFGTHASLRVVAEVMAGQTTDYVLQSGEAVRIMTGAPVPSGADAVVMLEEATVQGDEVTLRVDKLAPGDFVMARGREMKTNEVVLDAGTRLRATELGLLATVGCVEPVVVRRPTVAVLTSGDEIVAPTTRPGPGQIRNSNSAMMVALAEAAGAEVKTVRHAPDDLASIEAAVREGLQSDFLLLAGGVSAGDRDYVPEALARAKVQEVFHKVRLKPGKPLWFGTAGDCRVFGLPGNPVSVLACFYVFVRRALAWSEGSDASGWSEIRLAASHDQRGDRAVLHPMKHTAKGAELLDWFGSPDLRSICRADGFVLLPPGTTHPETPLPAFSTQV